MQKHEKYRFQKICFKSISLLEETKFFFKAIVKMEDEVKLGDLANLCNSKINLLFRRRKICFSKKNLFFKEKFVFQR